MTYPGTGEALPQRSASRDERWNIPPTVLFPGRSIDPSGVIEGWPARGLVILSALFLLAGTLLIPGALAQEGDSSTAGTAELPTRTEDAKLAAPYVGFSLAIDGDAAVLGGPGPTLIFQQTDTGWQQEVNLSTRLNLSDDDEPGASLALDAGTVLVGAADEEDNGRVHAFTRGADDDWSEQAVLKTRWANDFGRSIALEGDTAVVGAPRTDGDVPQKGAAFVFTRTKSTWTKAASLNLSGPSIEGAHFGSDVAISGDRVIVGGLITEEGNSSIAQADVFTRTPNGWEHGERLNVSVQGSIDGTSVAIDGRTAMVGANIDDGAGKVQVFQGHASGWEKTTTLTSPGDPDKDGFGAQLALAGNHLVVGATISESEGDLHSTAVWFTRTDGAWNPEAILEASDWSKMEESGDFLFGWFGIDVSEGRALIGGFNEYGPQGGGYIYELANGQNEDGTGAAGPSEDGRPYPETNGTDGEDSMLPKETNGSTSPTPGVPVGMLVVALVGLSVLVRDR